MAAEVYVYYRVAAADEAAVASRVDAFQSALRRRFAGLQARLLRRRDNDGDGSEVTLMEIYAGAAASDDGEVLAAVGDAARAIAPLLRGARHVEVFEPCA